MSNVKDVLDQFFSPEAIEKAKAEAKTGAYQAVAISEIKTTNPKLHGVEKQKYCVVTFRPEQSAVAKFRYGATKGIKKAVFEKTHDLVFPGIEEMLENEIDTRELVIEDCMRLELISERSYIPTRDVEDPKTPGKFITTELVNPRDQKKIHTRRHVIFLLSKDESLRNELVRKMNTLKWDDPIKESEVSNTGVEDENDTDIDADGNIVDKKTGKVIQ